VSLNRAPAALSDTRESVGLDDRLGLVAFRNRDLLQVLRLTTKRRAWHGHR